MSINLLCFVFGKDTRPSEKDSSIVRTFIPEFGTDDFSTNHQHLLRVNNLTLKKDEQSAGKVVAAIGTWVNGARNGENDTGAQPLECYNTALILFGPQYCNSDWLQSEAFYRLPTFVFGSIQITEGKEETRVQSRLESQVAMTKLDHGWLLRLI